MGIFQRAANGALAIPAYFEGVEQPTTIQRGTFSDDWVMVNAELQKVKQQMPEMDINHVYRTLLAEAAEHNNDAEFWAILNTAAVELIQGNEQLQNLAVGESMNLFERANELIRLGVVQLHVDWPALPN